MPNRVLPFAVLAQPAPPVESRLESGQLVYGGAFTAEVVAAPGPICSVTRAPCVISSGGGLATRVGYRFHSPWYLGGAYEFSKQDAHKAMFLPILQQFRLETRFMIPTSKSLSPFITAGGGGAVYGSGWSVQTWGGTLFLGLGAELSLSKTSALVLAVQYRALLLTSWVDTAGEPRPTGVVSLLGIELSMEQRDPLY